MTKEQQSFFNYIVDYITSHECTSHTIGRCNKLHELISQSFIDNLKNELNGYHITYEYNEFLDVYELRSRKLLK